MEHESLMVFREHISLADTTVEPRVLSPISGKRMDCPDGIAYHGQLGYGAREVRVFSH